jgi:hypothetical protein
MTPEGQSLADLLDLVTPYIDDRLVSSDVCSRLKAAASMLPPLPGILLECQLDNKSADADLCVRATSTDGGREILAGQHLQYRLPEHWLDQRAWQCVSAFSQEWTNPHSELYRYIETTWLEFDYATLQRVVPIPCFFVCFPALSKDADKKLLTTALSLLISKQVRDAITPCLTFALDCLPDSGTIFSVGSMYSRQTDALRLCLSMPVRDVPGYLVSMGMGEAATHLCSLLELIEVCATRIDLDLDVGNVIGTTIGIEARPDNPDQWPLLLHQLVTSRLCFESKYHAMLAWPGFSETMRGSDLSQIRIQAIAPGVEHDDIVFVRRLNHVKFVYRGQQSFDVKGYLYAGYGWRDQVDSNDPPT